MVPKGTNAHMSAAPWPGKPWSVGSGLQTTAPRKLYDTGRVTRSPKPHAAPPLTWSWTVAAAPPWGSHEATGGDPAMETAKSPSRLNGGSYKKPLGIPCFECVGARAFPPHTASPSSHDQNQRVWAQRPGPEGSADTGTPRAAPTVTCPRCQAGERPPSCPWHRRPLQTASLSSCQQFSGLSCARAAGGGPVEGPCPPSPLGTPLIRRNVCVCAFDSFKGKKLSLGRIPSGTPAAGHRGGILGLGGGASAGTPATPGLPPALPETTSALRGIPWLGRCEGQGHGQAGQAAPAGFRSYP